MVENINMCHNLYDLEFLACLVPDNNGQNGTGKINTTPGKTDLKRG